MNHPKNKLLDVRTQNMKSIDIQKMHTELSSPALLLKEH